ncbi:hypothetical protein ACFPOE_19215 [Caenimonas terrae]|uniref:Uncharacterized protein n=2 Tax=Caenimonas terrae TaxID=696074 RepID=A0ABW0NGH0_9BURK
MLAGTGVSLLTAMLGCGLWWGYRYLTGVRTARGGVALQVPLPLACAILAACAVLGGIAARSAYYRASSST